MNEQNNIVEPEIYSKEYFLSDNEGFKEYLAGLDSNMHPKFKLALKYGCPAKGETVLDLGFLRCFFGELVIVCTSKQYNKHKYPLMSN